MKTYMTEQSVKHPLKVLLINDQQGRSARMVGIITTAGYELVTILNCTTGLLHQIEQYQPDIVLIELKKSDKNLLDDLHTVKDFHPLPIVMFANNDDPLYLEKAVNAGVTTYLLEGFNIQQIKPIIDLAIARFKSYQSLRQALDKAESKLENESIIIRAKNMLMEKHKISENKAHKTLRNLSMETNLTLPEAARSTINILEKS